MKKDDFSIAFNKYNDHPLFKKCIQTSCPPGWILYLDKAVKLVEAYNKSDEKHNIGFAQVKVKFGRLTIYLAYYGSEKSEAYSSWAERLNIDGVYKKISEICNNASRHCAVCSKEKVPTVINTRVKYICFDHYFASSTRF
jgi:hypothetical protein